MKKVYTTEVADTLVAIGIIAGFYGLMVAIAFLSGL